jgi:hypothetical protein
MTVPPTLRDRALAALAARRQAEQQQAAADRQQQADAARAAVVAWAQNRLQATVSPADVRLLAEDAAEVTVEGYDFRLTRAPSGWAVAIRIGADEWREVNSAADVGQAIELIEHRAAQSGARGRR